MASVSIRIPAAAPETATVNRTLVSSAGRGVEQDTASLGVGGARRSTTNVTLEDGDALVMHQGMQERYEHCIKKKDIDAGIRVSFTFRAQQPKQ